MQNAKVVIDTTGPLPITQIYTPVDTEQSLIMISGPCWSNDKGMLTGIKLSIDGTEVGRSVIFSNIPTQHRTTTPVIKEYKIPFALDGQGNPIPVTFKLEAINSQTIGDEYDNYNVTVIN